MKKNRCLVLVCIAFNLAFANLNSQNLPAANFSGGNADLDAVGRNPGLDFVFQQFRNAKNEFKEIKYEGSPFLHEDFKKETIYSTQGMEGNAFVKYDGYNDQVQLKEQLVDQEIKTLLPREDIFCKIDDESIYYREYFDKKGNYKKGHLFKLGETDMVAFYQKNRKRFKEGKEASTSLEIAVPNKFIYSFELYAEKKGDKKEIRYVKPSKKEILRLFENDANYEEIKAFFSKNRLNLKENNDVKELFTYINKL